KTRLAGEFLRFALADGATVLQGRGYDAKTGIPYDPVVQALRGALQAPGLAGTAPEWLGEVTPPLPEFAQRSPRVAEAAPARGRRSPSSLWRRSAQATSGPCFGGWAMARRWPAGVASRSGWIRSGTETRST